MTDQSKGIFQVKYNLQISSIPAEQCFMGFNLKNA